MRFVGCAIALTVGVFVGCSSRSFEGPTVDAFVGSVTHKGKTVTFAEGEQTQVKLIHETGQSFGIPIKSDGTFKIGWMPIGKYSAMMTRPRSDGKGMTVYQVPDGLTIEAGKTEYNIELGKGWKP